MPEEIPSTVRIVRFHQTGDAEVLMLETVPTPEPAAGEIRLRVKAIGLNRAEVMFRRGQYLVQPQLPSLIGYEASGTIEAVGPGVDTGLIGMIVSTVPAFPADKYGVYGEVAIVPVHAIAAYPKSLSFEQGTSIWMQYLTAYGALIQQGKLAKGDFVLITAASSSVGIAAIEIARAEGAISIATTRTSRKKAELLALGADFVIVTEEEDLAARVHEITGGKGTRIAFDPVAGNVLDAIAAAASVSGIIFEYGALSAEPHALPALRHPEQAPHYQGLYALRGGRRPRRLRQGQAVYLRPPAVRSLQSKDRQDLPSRSDCRGPSLHGVQRPDR